MPTFIRHIIHNSYLDVLFYFDKAGKIKPKQTFFYRMCPNDKDIICVCMMGVFPYPLVMTSARKDKVNFENDKTYRQNATEIKRHIT